MFFPRRGADPWELVLDALGLGMLATWIITSWESPWPIVLTVSIAISTALLLRRRFLTLAVVAAASAVVVAAVTASNAIGPWATAQIVLFSWSLRGPRYQTLWLAFAVAGHLLLTSLLAYPLGSPGLPLGVVAWTFGVWGLATSVASQRELVRALARRAEELVHDREREIQRRLTDQRMQIARDLHDDLAHNVAVISMNAGAAETALPPGSELSQAALRTVRSTARGMLTELQEILGLLRGEASRDTVLPQLSDIVRAAEEIGLHVEVSGTWVPAGEPASSHVTAARILQESLTNARKHGRDMRATVALMTSGDSWTMITTNTVPPAHRRREDSLGGFGLIGMKERADLVGGRFTAERKDTQWLTSLTLPLRAPELREAD